jgi:hypothetical protein
MSTGTAALDEATQLGNGRDAISKAARLGGQQFQGIGQHSESVHTGSALTGAFAFEVPGYAADLEQGTDVVGKQRHDSGAN